MESNKKILLTNIGIAILVVLVSGVTFAFFNYTRTGTANIIKTGRIAFNSEQGTAINLTNMFPIDVSQGIPNDATKVGTVTINVAGDTTFGEGVEYKVSAVNVSNTVGTGQNAKSVPISIDVGVTSKTNNDPATTLGTSSNDYFNDRGGDTSYYSVVAGSTISTDDELLMGYIAPGQSGVDGNIVIRAYLDASRIAITDTYNGNETDNMGTTVDWVDDRTVFTSEEWNALQTNGVSFQIKVESNEGTWIEKPINIIESCPDCKFMYYVVGDNQGALLTTWNMAGWDDINNVKITVTPTVITEGLYDDYEELINTTGKDYFLGVKLNSSNQVTNTYACGVKGDVPFCIEGTLTEDQETATKYVANQTLLQGANLYNNLCTLQGNGYEYTECGPWDNSGLLSAGAYSYGYVFAGVSYYNSCYVNNYGRFGCVESGGN